MAPTSYYHDAVTPGLKSNGLQDFDIIDDSDPVFAEPNWAGSFGPPLSVRIFQTTSTLESAVSLVIGLLILGFSISFTMYLNNRYTTLTKID
jgi:hypothetical protein